MKLCAELLLLFTSEKKIALYSVFVWVWIVDMKIND